MEKTVWIRQWEGRFFVYAGNNLTFDTDNSEEIFRLTSLLKSLGVSYTIESRAETVPESPAPDYDISDW